MNCNDIKNLLPEYIADEINGEVKQSIDRHLKSCASCRKEHESLRTYFSLTSSLEKKKAPANFLTELHTVIKKKEKKSLKHLAALLFLPIKIKLPLEAAGVLAVSLIIVFFFKPFHFIQKETFLVSENEKSLAEESIITETLNSGKINDAVPAAEGKDRKVSAKRQVRSLRFKEPPSPPIIYELAMEIHAERSAFTTERESSENLSGATINRMEKKKESYDVQAPSKSLKSEPADEIAGKDSDDAPDKPYSGNISSVRNLISILDGTIAEERDETGRKGMYYIIFSLPSKNYLNMVSQLKTLGLIIDSKQVVPPKEETIKVRLIIDIKK
ncbi:MAG: hypothetical protein CVV44_04580 [Spirochaetae bacterium HGW-Spirochaetae-1]|jgi:hypothetical protein|nr:MAG: hypothetical protein CVV44_04580 [Spirochaetae bacterium HGW-Spirochaetae-1]